MPFTGMHMFFIHYMLFIEVGHVSVTIVSQILIMDFINNYHYIEIHHLYSV
jgi:hypothetical protein